MQEIQLDIGWWSAGVGKPWDPLILQSNDFLVSSSKGQKGEGLSVKFLKKSSGKYI